MRPRGAADSLGGMKQQLSLVTIIAALSLSACGKPDEAALAKGDAAFKGQTIDGQLQAVASRPVMVGQGGPRAAACPARAMPAADALTVHWSTDANAPAKAEIAADTVVAQCERDGPWSGVVFPAFGQEIDECYLAEPVTAPREYQGPCRWGWAETSGLKAAAE